MEHLERFGLEREPFRNEPQPDFWFESRGAADARARLLRCLRQGKELSVLCGEVGAGTTTLARRVLDDLDPDVFEVGLLVFSNGAAPPVKLAAPPIPPQVGRWPGTGAFGSRSPSRLRLRASAMIASQLTSVRRRPGPSRPSPRASVSV